MGKFVAYRKVDSAKADEIDASLNRSYYKAILKNALGDRFTESDAGERIGFIQLDSVRIKNIPTALNRIAEEEAKYFFKWEVNGSGVKDSAGKDVLNTLERVDIQRYSVKSEGGKSYRLLDKTVIDQINTQRSTLSLRELPLKIEDDNHDNQLVVSAPGNGVALYLDADSDNQLYKYKSNGKGGYDAVYTWIPKERKVTDDIVAQNASVLEYYPERAEDIIEDNKNLRYLYHLYNECKTHEYIKQTYKTFFGMGTSASVTHASNMLDAALNEKDNAAVVRKAASNAAKTLPSSYRCFYYRSGNEIDSFLSDVSISAEGGGSGGYLGRADRAIEVEYRWRIVPKPSDIRYNLVKLLSYIIGLHEEYMILDGHPDPDPKEFYETNYPYAATGGDNPLLLFQYYKMFKGDQTRRNNPKISYDIKNKSKIVAPGKPRTNLRRPKVFSKPEDKTNKYPQELRQMRKGYSLTGEALGQGDKSTREDAGSEMAKALNGYSFYSKAIEQADGAITSSKLPATSFAKYVIKNDKSAIKSWKVAHDLSEEQEAAVTTDQEWCHLYGHGDGGKETRDNFISGSKHCNTEQLAIETGQRRVSQNDDIPPEHRKKLRWRITADLILNDGARVADYNKINIEGAWGNLRKIWKEENTELEKSVADLITSGDTASDNAFQTCLKHLAKEILTAKHNYRELDDLAKATSQERKVLVALVAFQDEFYSKCFLFLPLGERVHYRVFFDNEKSFMHHFDAQSQSFDVYEAKILDYTVEYALYAAMAKKKDVQINEGENKLSVEAYYYGLILHRAKDLSMKDAERKYINNIITHAEQIAIILKQDVINKQALQAEAGKFRDIPKPSDINPNLEKSAEEAIAAATPADDPMEIDEVVEKIEKTVNVLKRKRSYSDHYQKVENAAKRQKKDSPQLEDKDK